MIDPGQITYLTQKQDRRQYYCGRPKIKDRQNVFLNEHENFHWKLTIKPLFFLWSGFPFRHQFDKACSAGNVLSLRLTFSLRIAEHDVASQYQISSPRAVHFPSFSVDYFLELILSIYRFKRVNFLSVNSTFESNTLKTIWPRHSRSLFSSTERSLGRDVTIVINSRPIPPDIH